MHDHEENKNGYIQNDLKALKTREREMEPQSQL